MRQLKFEFGNLGTIIAALILLSGGFIAGKASVKKDVCVLIK